MKKVLLLALTLLLILSVCGVSSDAQAATKKRTKSPKSKTHASKKADPKASKYTIALDAGHADNNPGKRSCPYNRDVTHTFKKKTVTVKKGEIFKEHWANVGVAVQLEMILTKCGFKVVRSGWDDENAKDDTYDYASKIPEEFPRRDKIRAANSDITISIHYNAFGNGVKWENTARGLVVFYWEGHEQSRILADHIEKQLIAIYGQYDRGIKPNKFWMTDNSKMGTKAACLIEHAFMTCEDEAYEYFSNPEAWFNYATATARGLCNFLDVKYVGPKPTVQKSEPVIPAGRANF